MSHFKMLARTATDTLNIITRCFSVRLPVSHLYLSLLRPFARLLACLRSTVYGTEVLKGKYTSFVVCYLILGVYA